MCGIIGYIGKKRAISILIGGLKRLEYRGYDSAGLVVFNGAEIRLAKAKGQVKELENRISQNWDGNIGIAHTRWATHGEPNEKNAHPHTDCTGRIFVCHNGIIENYKLLKTNLISRGHKFKSDTDTEVLSHLLEENMRYGERAAILKTLKQIRGTYGLAIIAVDWPNKLIAARNGSPLTIGIGDGEYIMASDASALADAAKNIIYMQDGEAAILSKKSIKFFDINNNLRLKKLSVSKRKEKMDLKIEAAQKNNFPHFMLKEICEQPESVINSFRGRLIRNRGLVKLGGLENARNKLQKIERLIITGCGTAHLAGMVGKLMIEELCGIPCEAEIASEFRYRSEINYHQNLAMVAISQSGETADTLAALRRFKENNILTLGIVNVVGSTIARETDAGIYNHIGPEIGVASTKAFTSQLVILALFALFICQERDALPTNSRKKIISEIEKIPIMIKRIFSQKEKIKLIAKKYSSDNFLYIGRKYNFPMALEGALKLKEVSYIHAEGYGAGEMKHGPIAMIDEHFPTIAIAPVDSVYSKTVSNIEEIRARCGKIIAITTEGNKKIEHIANDWLYIPNTLEMLTPILLAIPLQLLAYYFGVSRGFDVDKPRNLAKSVTVE